MFLEIQRLRGGIYTPLSAKRSGSRSIVFSFSREVTSCCLWNEVVPRARSLKSWVNRTLDPELWTKSQTRACKSYGGPTHPGPRILSLVDGRTLEGAPSIPSASPLLGQKTSGPGYRSLAKGKVVQKMG